MTASSISSSPRMCPSCGARNSAVSLFCAECGTSLNGGDEETSSYSPFAPEPDSQATSAFTPTTSANDDAGATRVAKPVTSTVQPFAPGWEPDPEPAATGNGARQSNVVVYAPAAPAQPRGMRGFFLGLLAALLILAVLAAWMWAGIFDAGTRSSISDFFSFLDFTN